MEPSAPTINLGELKIPKNSLIMTSAYFPSKVGGKPAWLIPEKAPELECQVCSTPLVFLLQLYCPLSSKDEHRQLVLLSCLGPECVGKQSAIICVR